MIIDVAGRRGLRSVEAIRRALVAEDAEFAQMAMTLEFPRAYCFTRAMIVAALREACEAPGSDGRQDHQTWQDASEGLSFH